MIQSLRSSIRRFWLEAGTVRWWEETRPISVELVGFVFKAIRTWSCLTDLGMSLFEHKATLDYMVSAWSGSR